MASKTPKNTTSPGDVGDIVHRHRHHLAMLAISHIALGDIASGVHDIAGDIARYRQTSPRMCQTSPAISPKAICVIATSLNLPQNQGSDDAGDIASDIVRCRRASPAMPRTSPAISPKAIRDIATSPNTLCKGGSNVRYHDIGLGKNAAPSNPPLSPCRAFVW